MTDFTTTSGNFDRRNAETAPVGVSDYGISDLKANEDHSHAMGRLTYAQYARNAVQAIPTAVSTNVLFDARVYDPAYFISSNLALPQATLIVPPKLNGLYTMSAQAYASGAGMGAGIRAFIDIIINGTYIFRNPIGTGEIYASCGGLFPLVAGDTINLQCYQATGVAVNVIFILVIARLCP